MQIAQGTLLQNLDPRLYVDKDIIVNFTKTYLGLSTGSVGIGFLAARRSTFIT